MSGRETRLRCFSCRAGQPAGLRYRCQDCEGPLVAELDHVAPPWRDPSAVGIWRQRGVLPDTSATVTLGEGDTPLLSLPDERLGFRLLAKLESANPTLSFKDRAMALGASLALDMGAPGLVVASTGNSAVATAAYAAAAGLPCTVVAGTASRAGTKLQMAASFGATVVEIEGDYSDAYQHAVRLEGDGWHNMTTTYRNPYLVEAYRTIAFELVEQLGTVPSAVVVPVGSGPLLRGIRNGFLDLIDLGLADRQPRLIAVQATACQPLVAAWAAGRSRWLATLESHDAAGRTVAEPIADPLRGYEAEGLLTLEAVADASGCVTAVEDDEIIAAMRALASTAGLLVEPAAATALAALRNDDVADVLTDAATVVLALTGHGVKDTRGLTTLAAEGVSRS
jgi:threonine synthase